MAFKDKEKERQRGYSRLPTIICPVCKILHKRIGKRMSTACAICYPRYRRLYCLLASSKYRATKANIAYDLDMDWILSFPSFCCKTGIPFTFENNGSNFSNRPVSCPSIDKINPRLGYTKNNCQLVCWWYNSSKLNFTDQEVLGLCIKVVETANLSKWNSVLNVPE